MDDGLSGLNPPNGATKEAGVNVGGGGIRVTKLLGDEAAIRAGFNEAGIGDGVPLDVGSFGGESPPSEDEKAGAIVGGCKGPATTPGEEATIGAGVTEVIAGVGLPLYVGTIGGKPPTCDKVKAGAIVGS